MHDVSILPGGTVLHHTTCPCRAAERARFNEPAEPPSGSDTTCVDGRLGNDPIGAKGDE